MEIKAKEIRLVPLSDIKLNPENRNKHSAEQVEQFKKVLLYQGFRIPGVVSNQTGYLAAGELRYLTMKALGQTHMPVMFQDFDDWDHEYIFGVSDNEIAKQSVIDLAAIHVDISKMGPFDTDLLGLKDFQFEPSEMDVEVGEGGLGSEPDVSQCPNCGHLLK